MHDDEWSWGAAFGFGEPQRNGEKIMSTFEINRRSLLKRSAGVMALAMGAGTPFLSSRKAYAQAADLAAQQLRTIGLSVTVQERILEQFKKASGVGTTSGTAATFPDAQTKILSGSKDYDCWEIIAERLPSIVMTNNVETIPAASLKTGPISARPSRRPPTSGTPRRRSPGRSGRTRPRPC